MINPVFLLSGIGMMLVGVLPVLFWRYKTLVPWKDFRLGAYLWAAAVGVKAVMDFTVTPFFVQYLSGIYATIGIAIVSGVYLGLRTGILESGFVYAAALKARVAKFDFEQAVALGLAFGAAEALLLGLSSFINVSVLIAFPQILGLMPPQARVTALSQLSLDSIAAAAPVIERAAVMAVHVFCTVLAVHAARNGKARFFMLSLGLRAILDGMLPLLSLAFGTGTVAGIYEIEAFISMLGVASIAGVVLVRKGYRERKKKREGGIKRTIALSAMLCAMLAIAAFAAAQPSAASALERRPVDFGSFSARYDVVLNGTQVGYSEFSYAGMEDAVGESLFIVQEESNLTYEGYGIYTTGTLYTTVDARPVFYESTITKGSEEKKVSCTFLSGTVNQTVTENGEDRSFISPAHADSFITANNMVSHWALLFRAARLEHERTYIVRLYSPSAETGLVRTLEVVGVQNVKIGGRAYEAYVFSESSGNLYYVTQDGILLKVRNGALEITLSSKDASESGGMFR